MKSKTYKVKIEKEGRLYVIMAKTPREKKYNIVSQGKNFVDAFMMIGDAIQLHEKAKKKKK